MKRLMTLAAAVVLMAATAMATVVVVDGVHVRLRNGASTNAKIIKDAAEKPVYPAKGDTFEYLGTEGNYYRINYYGDTEVYISRDFCHLKDDAKKKVKTETKAKGKVVIVDGVNVRLRYTPSLKGEIVLNEEGQTLYPKKGSSFKYLGTEGSFYKIDYFGEELYISRDYSHLKSK